MLPEAGRGCGGDSDVTILPLKLLHPTGHRDGSDSQESRPQPELTRELLCAPFSGQFHAALPDVIAVALDVKSEAPPLRNLEQNGKFPGAWAGAWDWPLAPVPRAHT